MSVLAFDIEISNLFELRPGESLDQYAPFDISVAATYMPDGDCRFWYSKGPDDRPLQNLSREDAEQLLDYLETMQANGHFLVAWNGLGFDLRWIGHAAQDTARAARLALKIYDPMFQFFKLKGFPNSLTAVGTAMRIGIAKSLNAADAPRFWSQGQYDAVCQYVQGDAQMTARIAWAIHEGRKIAWVTSKGEYHELPIPGLQTVEQCLAYPMPDQSWMDKPMTQEKFTGWLAG